MKGLLILFVVFAHFLGIHPSSSSEHAWTQAIYCFINSFHMPAFICLSGYFSSSKDPVKSIISLLILYAFSSFVWILYHSIVYLHRPAVDSFLLFLPELGLWYLLSLVFWRMTVPLLTQIRYPIFLVVTAAIYGAMIGRVDGIGEGWSISRTIGFFPFFAAGYFARTKEWNLLHGQLSRTDYVFLLTAMICLPLVVFIAFKKPAVAHRDNRGVFG